MFFFSFYHLSVCQFIYESFLCMDLFYYSYCVFLLWLLFVIVSLFVIMMMMFCTCFSYYLLFSFFLDISFYMILDFNSHFSHFSGKPRRGPLQLSMAVVSAYTCVYFCGQATRPPVFISIPLFLWMGVGVSSSAKPPPHHRIIITWNLA